MAGRASSLAEARATAAANYLIGAQEPDGRFRYEYDFVRGRFRDGDNLVRQTAVGFVLAEYLARSKPAGAAETVRRAIGYYADHSTAWRGGLVATADPKASAGATALALTAELIFFDATGDAGFADARLGWLHGLAALQVASGGFARGPGDDTESPYFNGEAWLALAHFQRLFPGERTVADMLARAEATFTDRYARAPDGGFAHWGLMAASLRFQSTAEPRYLDLIEKLADGLITELSPAVNADTNSCTTVEGLAAATLALRRGKRSGPFLDRLTVRMNAELAKNLELQIEPGETRLSLGGERILTDPTIGTFAGMFLNGRFAARGRIDFTQHCLSALMQYATLRRAE